MLLFSTFLIFMFVWLGFHLLIKNDIASLFLFFCGAAILTSIDQGNNLAAFVENSQPEIRYSVIAFSYNLGNAFFGATGPIVVTLLTQRFNAVGLSHYLMVLSIITFITALTLRNKHAALAGFFSRQEM